ncbi:aminotransferase class I/II-fold pyridoxal phosphate-dependent enzyme [bacterium]|nr:MAG: aminotransferase class I/II-fold pyridoxal phosphate-dependent enzyme [bacterium]
MNNEVFYHKIVRIIIKNTAFSYFNLAKMSIFREIPPTAGLPIYAKDFLSILKTTNRQGSLEEDFKNYLGVPYAAITYSGTAALYLILETIKTLSPKKNVIIPSFVCPLLPLAIKRAGLEVKVCDIQKNNFNFDLEQLREICSTNEDILAIVAVHLAGIPLDFDQVKRIASGKKIFIIEDCAQSLGAEYKGKKTGTQGEFSFFSLCRGKGLTIYEGGLITTTKKEFAFEIDRTIKRLIEDDYVSEGLKILELLGYWIFYRPELFWFVFRAPQIFWNWRGEKLKALAEYYTIDFPMHKVSGLRKNLGHYTFSRLEDAIGQQREKADYYQQRLQDLKGIKLIREPSGSRANYPYLALIFSDPQKCQSAKDLFRNTGLGVSIIYASSITEYNYLEGIVENQDCPNARYLAERTITLTTSIYAKQDNLDTVIEKLKNLLLT